MTPDEITTLLLLQCGALPHPELPDYDQWFGAGFGLDMLSDETQRQHYENMNYILEAKKVAQVHGITPEAFTKFIKDQRRD